MQPRIDIPVTEQDISFDLDSVVLTSHQLIWGMHEKKHALRPYALEHGAVQCPKNDSILLRVTRSPRFLALGTQ